MKRKLIKYSILVSSLLMLYLGYIAYQGPSVKGELTEKDLPPVSFEPDNGFYILRALLEPPEVEVPSPGVITKYREIYDLDKVQKIRKHIRKATEKEKEDLRKIEPYWKLLNQIFKVYNFAENYRQKKDILAYYLSRKKDVKKIEEGCSFFLKRYYRLINSEKISNTIQQMEDNNTIPFNVWGDIEDLGIVIDYPFQIRALNDLVCICAELHLKYDPNKTIKENLENLDSYKSIDPFSGEPYRYNSKKQILYSIGKNRKDDNGTPYSMKAWREPYDDIVIPCVINVKNRQKVQGARK